MVTTERSEDASRVQVVIEPNQSLTWRAALVFFATAAVSSLAIALTFTVMGYWPILPFAGLELLALGVALYLAARSGRRREVITITADAIRIEKGSLRSGRTQRGGPQRSREFARAWARVVLRKPRTGWYPSRLTVEVSGMHEVLGEFLTDEERRKLKTQLDALLVPAGVNPPATSDRKFE